MQGIRGQNCEEGSRGGRATGGHARVMSYYTCYDRKGFLINISAYLKFLEGKLFLSIASALFHSLFTRTVRFFLPVSPEQEAAGR
jgi:hypothetical protein